MCIIIVKKQGTEQDLEQLKESIYTSAIRNEHGAGYAYKRSGENKITFKKGYFDTDLLMSDIKKLNIKKEDELVVHLRYTTAGKTDNTNCHPFVADSSMINNISGKLKIPVVFHNGTFFEHAVKNSKFSDTYHFVKDVVSKPHMVDTLEHIRDNCSVLSDQIITFNKLAIMTPDSPVSLFGDFVEEGNYLYSNYYYKTPYNGKKEYGKFHGVNYLTKKSKKRKKDNPSCAIRPNVEEFDYAYGAMAWNQDYPITFNN